jgi:hypothetical protein
MKMEPTDLVFHFGGKKETQIDKLRSRIKNYLELDNVSLLAGAGTSFHLGAPTIRTIPPDLHEALSADDKIGEFYNGKVREVAGEGGDFNQVEVETFLNYLQASRFVMQTTGKPVKKTTALISKIQSKLFRMCNTQLTQLHTEYADDEQLKKNKYFYHEKFIKKLLQRPVNLRRVNLFTTNYDLAFEYAFDNCGVHYINGFSGFQSRHFRPETYDYDIYYPGQTTSGEVHRAEKVVRYYKLHGSLSWVSTEAAAENLYGIAEVLLGKEKPENDLIIYPCSTKKSYTLDLPYSELFRLFSASIKQSQAVLFCVGYSFNDEHINDIIFQALSIPSFTLFIVDFIGTGNEYVQRLASLHDPRILIIQGEYGKFTHFVSDVLPDLYEERDEVRIARTLNELRGYDQPGDTGEPPEDSHG